MDTPFSDRRAETEKSCCNEKILKDFGPNGQYRVTDIVTGDEIYIDLYCRPMKSKNRRWIKKKCQRKRILRPGFGIPKALFTVFYTALGPVLVDMMPRRQNMNGRIYGRKILPRGFTELLILKSEARPSRFALASAPRQRVTSQNSTR